MSESNPETKEGLQQTVSMLEQILEVMPDDLVTLRALYEASLKLEQAEKAMEALSRLDDLARAEQDGEMIDFVLNQYATIAEDSPEVQGRMERLKEIRHVLDLHASDPDQEDILKEKPADSRSRGGGRMDAEMALAWDLFQDEQLTQEEYSNVLHDLTEMSSRRMGVPVSVLHILHDRQFSRFERMLTHLCQKHSMPLMVLSQFADNEEIIRTLPLDFTSGNGAIPFATVGDDLLVGILNPLDKELLKQAEEICGRRCHPYLVAPDDYDRHLQKAKQPAE